MRDFKGMKRQRGRNRGGGGNSGGGKPTQQNANRAFESNGPDNVKVRGNAQHVFERYQQLARDAGSGGDRVLAENYLQHAEHYFRLLRALQPHRTPSEIIGRDQVASGYDIDFEDESGFNQPPPEEVQDSEARDDGDSRPRDRDRDRGDWQPREDRFRDDRSRDDRPRDDRQRDDRARDDRPRDDRPRDDRPRDDRPREDRARDDRPRDDRPRDDRPREGRDRDRWRERDRNRPRDDRPRDDRPRDDRPRDDRPRDDRPRDERPRAEADERREREPYVEPAPEPSGPMLRDSDGGASHAPAFLQAARPAPVADDVEAAPKPRRRRAPRSFEGDAKPETEDA
jgi:hypothetical protein